MTYEPQRILVQGGSDSDAQETPGVEAIHPRRQSRLGTKAGRSTNIKVGDRFGRLTAIAPSELRIGKQKCWIFRCDCGWEGLKMTYRTVTQPGTCGRRCPFQLVDYARNPNGSGSKTAQGYIAVRVGAKGVFEHRLVWERAHGPIPDGMQIHHKDMDRSNNSLSNLQLVTQHEHQRIHAGWLQVDGVWNKPCHGCGRVRAISEFYCKLRTVSAKCKDCTKERQRIYRLCKRAATTYKPCTA